jgi:ABC-type transport system involved in multi-copper enzyme maturation permease subunit
MFNTLTVASYTFKDAIRARWLIIFAILFFFLAINLPDLVLASAGYLPPNYLSEFIPDLIGLTFPFLPLLALPMGSPSIVEERENGTLQFILSNPISRNAFFAGKTLGLLIATTLVVIVGYGIAGLYAYGANFGDYGPLLLVMVAAAALNAVMLMLALIISVQIKRKITAIGSAVFLWFLFSIISNYDLLGNVLSISRLTDWAMFLVLLNPVESSKTIALLNLSSDPSQLGMSGLIAYNVLGTYLATIVIAISLVIWIAVLLAGCFLLFRRQDAV